MANPAARRIVTLKSKANPIHTPVAIMQPTLNPCFSGQHLVGYARVSTDDQDLSLQIDALTKLGIPKASIFMDKLSGAKTDRPGLARCLATLQSGDILVVWRLDRLGRSMRHLITVVEDLRSKGIGFPVDSWERPDRQELRRTLMVEGRVDDRTNRRVSILLDESSAKGARHPP